MCPKFRTNLRCMRCWRSCCPNSKVKVGIQLGLVAKTPAHVLGPQNFHRLKSFACNRSIISLFVIFAYCCWCGSGLWRQLRPDFKKHIRLFVCCIIIGRDQRGESKLKCQIACATRNENQIRPQMSWPCQKAKSQIKQPQTCYWQQLKEQQTRARSPEICNRIGNSNFDIARCWLPDNDLLVSCLLVRALINITEKKLMLKKSTKRS